jgi:hypothetical protein
VTRVVHDADMYITVQAGRWMHSLQDEESCGVSVSAGLSRDAHPRGAGSPSSQYL